MSSFSLLPFLHLALAVLFSLTLVFHCLVLAQVVPYTVIWGGRMKNVGQMRVFESISILVNVFFLWIVLQNGRFIAPFLADGTLRLWLWAMLGVFLANTVGNLFSKNFWEKLIFTPLTLLIVGLLGLLLYFG